MTPADFDTVRRSLGDRYAIVREIGRGGMGTVYLARDLRLDRAVALKVLPAVYASDPALRERFLRETRTSAQFTHPNIVPVFAVEETDDLVAYAMGYVEGESLDARVRRTGPLSTRELVRLLQDVGYALSYAHGRGVVHRDIKPDNVMIERATGRAMLMDFGIARVIQDAASPTPSGLTRVGEVVGTPEYMSPEQACGEAVDGRSDLYSLGLVAFFAATGRTVMSDLTPQRIMVRQLTEPVPSLADERADLPLPLTNAIDRCVAKDAADRFQTAEALVEAIEETQLAAPDIPIPIRGFAQDLMTLALLVLVLLIIGFLTIRFAPAGISRIDHALPLVFLLGIAAARTLQSLSIVRRLAEDGFSAPVIMQGLRAVMDENASLREQLRNNPDSHVRRRRSLRIALLLLPVVALCAYGAYLFRELPIRDVRPDGSEIIIIPTPNVQGTLLVVTGELVLAFALVLLLRSPFRMPAGERAFRAIWLGPVGRAFIHLGSRGVVSARRTPGRTPSHGITAQVAPVRAAPAPARPDVALARLEARIAELEKWREKEIEVVPSGESTTGTSSN